MEDTPYRRHDDLSDPPLFREQYRSHLEEYMAGKKRQGESCCNCECNNCCPCNNCDGLCICLCECLGEVICEFLG